MIRGALLIAAGLVLSLTGCGTTPIAKPPTGPQTIPLERWLEVDTPPPAVQVEEVGPQPSPKHVWIDGQWMFQSLAQRWTWEQGRWCIPPQGATYYAPAEVVRFRKVVGRVVRWNEPFQRYEEVDSRDDRWRWMRGRFYGAKGPGGVAMPQAREAMCESTSGFDGEKK